jgi:hypothetical protein
VHGEMSALGRGCVKTCAREEGAELFSLSLLPTVAHSVFVYQIDEVRTKVVSANSTSEFSHSLGFRFLRCNAIGALFPPDIIHAWPDFS